MAKYDLQIELLERLIHNWYDIKDKEDFYELFGDNEKGISVHTYGLCWVCYLEDLKWEYYDVMFQDWMYWNGDHDYPVGYQEEFVNKKLITDNPKRLHLAVHCLRWLREHNLKGKYK